MIMQLIWDQLQIPSHDFFFVSSSLSFIFLLLSIGILYKRTRLKSKAEVASMKKTKLSEYFLSFGSLQLVRLTGDGIGSLTVCQREIADRLVG